MCQLDRATLYQVNITGCQGLGLSLREVSAVQNIGGGIDLAEGSIVDSNFSYADLTGANLSQCDLSGNRFSHAVFDRAVLTGAQLTDCELHGLSADGLEIRNADLRGSDIQGLDAREVDLEGVRITWEQQSVILETLGLIVTD